MRFNLYLGLLYQEALMQMVKLSIIEETEKRKYEICTYFMMIWALKYVYYSD